GVSAKINSLFDGFGLQNVAPPQQQESFFGTDVTDATYSPETAETAETAADEPVNESADEDSDDAASNVTDRTVEPPAANGAAY
ncbi:MAG: hypothetical protein AAF283_13970, partial [Cyanobacteria bacterium P01_A01_bin.70]